MHSSLNFFHVSLLYAVSWIFLLQWVSHSHFQLVELPYAQRKGFIIRNVLCKIDSRVQRGRGAKKETPVISSCVWNGRILWRVVVKGFEPFKWAKSADASCLPCGNGFVCSPNQPFHPPVSKEYWGLSSIHFLLPWPFILIREWSPPPGPTPNNWHCVLLGQEKYTLSTYPLGEVAVYEKIVAEHWTESVLLL